MLDDEVLSKTVRLNGEEPQALARASDRDEREPARLRFGGDRLAALAVDIDHCAGARRQQVTEQAELLREIPLEALVIVQMVARDVGEGASGEFDAVDAALLQAVARSLDRKMGDAVLGESGKDRMQLDRVRRRVLEGLGAARTHDADSAEARGAEPLPRPNLAHEGGNRGLAVSAGDGDHRLGLETEEARGD